MLRRSLLWLGAAACVLLAVQGVSRCREKAASDPRRAFGAMKPSEVTRLGIAYLGDSVTLLRTASGHWVTAGDSFPADTARLRLVLGHLLGMQMREKVSDSADVRPLGEYGLDSASAKRVAWTLADGSLHRVVLGKTSGLDFGSTYWMRAGGREVYRTPGEFVWLLSSRSQDWKDTNLYVPFRQAEVRSVEVEWKSLEGELHLFRLERTGDTSYALTEPFDAPALWREAAKVFLHVAQFKIDEFVPGLDGTAAFSGLEAPWMTLRVTLKDGTERKVEAGNRVDRLYNYVRHPTHPAPVRVFAWRFDYFRKRPEEFVEEGR